MRDLREYARQTNFRLIVGALLILFIVGLGLIRVFYGIDGAIFGMICLLAGLSPLFLIWVILAGMDWIVKRVRRDED